MDDEFYELKSFHIIPEYSKLALKRAGEGGYRVDDRSRERLDKLESEVSNLMVRVTVAETNIHNINEKLSKIDSNIVWVIRLIVGGFIAAIAGFLYNGGI